MKKLFFYAATAVCAFACLTSCNDDDDANKTLSSPTVSIIAEGEPTSESISFVITPGNASACAYTVIEKGTEVPSAETVLDNGTTIDATGPTQVTQDGLIPETIYVVVAAVMSGNGETTSGQLEMTTASEPVPDGIVFDPERGSGRRYGSSNNVGITLRGLVDGIDYEASLDLYDDDVLTLNYLGEGTYTVASTTNDGDMNTEYSYLQKDNDQYHFLSGTLEVSIADGVYSMRLDVELDNEGGRFIGTFNGILDGMPIE